MKLPLQITFRNMDASDAMEAAIRERAEKLDQFYDQIMSCRIMVEAKHKHHQKGNQYHVRIDLKVPDAELVANKMSDLHHSYEDAYVAIRDAFDAMRRQLEEYARRRRLDVKSHETQPHGKITRLVSDEHYGMIESSDGREIYFHRNSLLNDDFDHLAVGAEVRFSEEMGERGPQASTVRIVGKHHIVG